MIELDAICGKHVIYYPALLAPLAMNRSGAPPEDFSGAALGSRPPVECDGLRAPVARLMGRVSLAADRGDPTGCPAGVWGRSRSGRVGRSRSIGNVSAAGPGTPRNTVGLASAARRGWRVRHRRSNARSRPDPS